MTTTARDERERSRGRSRRRSASSVARSRSGSSSRSRSPFRLVRRSRSRSRSRSRERHGRRHASTPTRTSTSRTRGRDERRSSDRPRTERHGQEQKDAIQDERRAPVAQHRRLAPNASALLSILHSTNNSRDRMDREERELADRKLAAIEAANTDTK